MTLQEELVRANLKLSAATAMHQARQKDWTAALTLGGRDRREKARWDLMASMEYLLDVETIQADLVLRMNGIEPHEAL